MGAGSLKILTLFVKNYAEAVHQRAKLSVKLGWS